MLSAPFQIRSIFSTSVAVKLLCGSVTYTNLTKRQTSLLKTHWQAALHVLEINVRVTSFFLSFFFLSFFVITTSFYLLNLGVEDYCKTWSHSVTHTQTDTHTLSLGHLRTSNRPVAESTTRQHTTDSYASGGIRTRNLSKRTAAHPRVRPRGHQDRPLRRSMKKYLWLILNVWRQARLC